MTLRKNAKCEISLMVLEVKAEEFMAFPLAKTINLCVRVPSLRSG